VLVLGIDPWLCRVGVGVGGGLGHGGLLGRDLDRSSGEGG
jgi:hypothetical protein